MVAYRAFFGHVDEFLPGAHFDSRQAVKDAKLHKEREAGISWGLDEGGERAADAIVLNQGYEDDLDKWDEVVYTGAGGRDRNTGRQIEDQTWENRGNASLRRSRISANPVRVIRGSEGEKDYSPVSGYRYDGLYEIVEEWTEVGKAGFRICRFRLRRLPAATQELTPVEQQVRDILDQRDQDAADQNSADVPTQRRTATVERIVRDTAVVRRVKRWHEYTCQICGLALTVGAEGKSYAEGAHIQALGGSAGGPDVEGNVLCLCPNCHVRLDRGALYLTDDFQVVDRYAEGLAARSVPLRTVEQHRIGERFLRAHRRFWRINDLY
ncbi:YDG/SRA domain-containing protein [Streptomyces sp. JV190]|uniref:YDG/SRA domain-containing protein n=1 Tax=Streptomyces sp. JV190 TaxID=3002533 RepID=UPI002E779C9D|nr:YDG/SRA domain-containing protein [Streptomyces sp. JV190]MEE1843241.1 YDG/SRA domain-containing protein [Streptomyces sp. JV190]